MNLLRASVVTSVVAATLFSSTAVQAQVPEPLIAAAAKSAEKKAELLRALVKGHVVIIASWTSGASKTLQVQDFMRNGKSFIPVFSDQQHFNVETKGSGFEGKGVSIDANMMASLLKGHETLVLNPGSKTPLDIQARELKALVDAARLPK